MDLGIGGIAEDRPRQPRRGEGRPLEVAAMQRIDLGGRHEKEEGHRQFRRCHASIVVGEMRLGRQEGSFCFDFCCSSGRLWL